MLILLPLLGFLFNSFGAARVEANLSLGFKATKLLRQLNPANCTVGNTTYAHGQTFKLDCKTQCVCENGRHACSSLCPKEQLPAPEDTISCRSPRLVEVPGHCCKMWLCENPTADVYATCHNSSTSPWTPCSQPCGMGISTRFAITTAGCHQLSNLRLCESRKCDSDNKHENNNNNNYNNNKNNNLLAYTKELSSIKGAALPAQQQLVISQQRKDIKDNYHAATLEHHRIRKGHECRSLQRLGPARIRLGACVSRKLYRPKLCGRCHHSSKCCVPSVSTTIQVELLCPLNADDPISYAERQQQQQQQKPKQERQQLWDTVSLEPIDQEFLQSHRIQIENKFIAVEWILKCECNRNKNCSNISNNNNNNSNNNIANNKQSNSSSSNSAAHVADNRYEQPQEFLPPNNDDDYMMQPDIIPYPQSNNYNNNYNNNNNNNYNNNYNNNNNNNNMVHDDIANMHGKSLTTRKHHQHHQRQHHRQRT